MAQDDPTTMLPRLQGEQLRTPNHEASRVLDPLLRLLFRGSVGRIVAAITPVAILVSSIPGAYFSWWHAIPFVSSWAAVFWPRWFLAAFALVILAFAPVWIIMTGWSVLGRVLSEFAALDEGAVQTALRPVRSAEGELSRGSAEDDGSGLIPLLKYSRAQLEADYEIGRRQARNSFIYSVMAMWVGFAFLLAGLVLYVLPLEKLGLVRPSSDFGYIVIGSGVTIEFVSALFLWVYRSSIAQLTYFFNRQIDNHNVVMCFRIASGMTEPDETKRLIVEKVLERTWTPERPTPVGTDAIHKLASELRKVTAGGTQS